MSDYVKTALSDGILTLTLSRPSRRNAFNQALREQLADALEAAAHDLQCWGIVLTGEGGHFSVGGDVDAFESMSGVELDALLGAAHRCVTAIRQANKPVVAAVEGGAAGGAAGLVLACDVIVAARDARFVFPFLKLGLVPDWGCVALLKAKVGDGMARRLLLHPAVLSGDEALASGVADEITEPGQAYAAALRRVRMYAGFPGDAWGRTKSMLNTDYPDLLQALAQELTHQRACIESPVFQQTLREFLRKQEGGTGESDAPIHS